MLQLVLLAAAFAQQPAPAIKLPETVKVQPGMLARVRPETAAKRVTWRVPAGVDAERVNDGLLLVATAPPGRYALTAAVCVGEDVTLADVVLVVEGIGPPPVEDVLRRDLLALAAAEIGADKLANLKSLAALYRQAAKIAETAGTAAELARQVKDAAGTLLGPGVLMPSRKRVADELARVFAEDVALTDASRKTLIDVYTRASTACEDGAK